MEKELFIEYLKTRGMREATIKTRVSNVQRVDREYDIDYFYSRNQLDDLIDQFNYSKKDISNGFEPAVCIAIEGDYYNGLATLKSALKLYRDFLNESLVASSKGASPTKLPVFKGTLADFTAFIGPHCRNLVNGICRKDRKSQKGICEYCGKSAELQSAHKTGEERPEIIKRILDAKYAINSSTYEIPLNDFDDEFVRAHLPVTAHIYFLCPDCHNAYDKKKTITDADINKKRARKTP